MPLSFGVVEIWFKSILGMNFLLENNLHLTLWATIRAQLQLADVEPSKPH